MLGKECYKSQIYHFWAFLGKILAKDDFFSLDFLENFTNTGKMHVMFLRLFEGKSILVKNLSCDLEHCS